MRLSKERVRGAATCQNPEWGGGAVSESVQVHAHGLPAQKSLKCGCVDCITNSCREVERLPHAVTLVSANIVPEAPV